MAQELRVVTIEDWSVCNNPENPNFLSFQGKLFGHPDFPDGSEATTSPIVSYIETEGVFLTKSRKYRLGKVDPTYELQFPNAFERILKAVPR